MSAAERHKEFLAALDEAIDKLEHNENRHRFVELLHDLRALRRYQTRERVRHARTAPASSVPVPKPSAATRSAKAHPDVS